MKKKKYLVLEHIKCRITKEPTIDKSLIKAIEIVPFIPKPHEFLAKMDSSGNYEFIVIEKAKVYLMRLEVPKHNQIIIHCVHYCTIPI